MASTDRASRACLLPTAPLACAPVQARWLGGNASAVLDAVSGGGLFLRLNGIAFGEPRGPAAPAQASYLPMFAHLAIVFAAGIYMPPALVAGFENVARLLG